MFFFFLLAEEAREWSGAVGASFYRVTHSKPLLCPPPLPPLPQSHRREIFADANLPSIKGRAALKRVLY